jgi:hypothetical protein
MEYKPNHYNIQIKPIFVKDGKEYPFEGLTDKERSKTTKQPTNIEFRFIIKTLRKNFGDDVEFRETKINNLIELTFLTDDEMKTLRNISEDTEEIPIKYGRSILKFEIGTYTYDAPPCSGMPDCECRECFCECEKCKY